MALQEGSGMSTYSWKYALEPFPLIPMPVPIFSFPTPLGNHERETRMITIRPSIFCCFETIKIWTFAVVALLSGTIVMVKNLLNWKHWYYVNMYYVDPNYM